MYPSLAFAGVAFVIVLLAENARIPVDNPATHLELTMIHEAMILEYSARHLALIEWAGSLKLLLLFLPSALPPSAPGESPLPATSSCWPWRSALLAAKLMLGGIIMVLIETGLGQDADLPPPRISGERLSAGDPRHDRRISSWSAMAHTLATQIRQPAWRP